MDTVLIEFANMKVRADTLLVLLTLLLTFLAVIIQIWRSTKREVPAQEPLLAALLAKPEIIEALKADNSNIKEIIEYLKSSKEPRVASSNPFGRLIEKVASDIQWDIAGVIGVGVTVVLLFMVVSGTIAQVPEQIFTGWLMILGYYFGKGAQSRDRG